ncbi:MAG: hypothetical protein DHS20C09_21880 [marine bacterium B5-7]|nr:MAG: hypothetical protein DHS20C09_21880 [marine bacterium B5-7]
MLNNRLLGLILMVLLIGLMWFYLTDASRDHAAPINLISQKPDDAKPKTNNKPAKIAATPAPEQPLPTPSKQPLVAAEDSAWTYLQLYQKYRLAFRCYYPYQSIHNAKADYDYVAEYINFFKHNNIKNQDSPSAKQIEQLEKFLTECLALQEQIAARDDFVPIQEKENYWNATRVYIEQWLLSYPTTTADELYLKKSWQLRSAWLKTLDALLLATHGENTLSDEEIATIQQQIKDLWDERRDQRRALAEAFTAEMSDAYDQMIVSLQNQLKDQLHVDKDYRNDLLQEWDAQTLALESRILDGPVESYQLITETLNLSLGHTFNQPSGGYQRFVGRRIQTKIPEYEILSDRLMPLSAVRMPSHFDLLYPLANLWLMCERGLACGPNSEWMTERCLGIALNKADDKACGLAVDRYFLETLLSPNQAIDITGLKTMLQALYGS